MLNLAIVNDIHVGKSLVLKGEVRASSHLIEEMLPDFLHGIVQRHAPDALINMGDLIRSHERDVDLQTYQRVIAHFQKLQMPVIHLIGNHEVKKMPLNMVEGVWDQYGFKQKSYGSKEINGFTLIWLGVENHPNDHRSRSLPEEQLQWLKTRIKEVHQPTIIFTHCAIDDHDVRGNYFYEGWDQQNKSPLFLTNQAEVRKIIGSSHSVIAVLQAHLHYFHAKKIDGISYITCPAMGDNICGPNAIDNVPGIYTMLSLEKNQITVKAYSGQYCFAGYS